MSFWSRLGAIAVGGAAFIPGLQPFAPELLGAAASIYGAGEAADASHNAAQTQQHATDQALGMNQRMYDDTSRRQAAVYADSRANFAPFVNLGTSAAGSLGNLLNLPPSNAMSTTPPAGAMPTGGGTLADPVGAYVLDAQGRPTPILAGGGTLLGGPQQAAQAQSQSSYAPEGKGGRMADGMEMLQAPDGSVRAVPASRVDFFLQRGARRASEA